MAGAPLDCRRALAWIIVAVFDDDLMTGAAERLTQGLHETGPGLAVADHVDRRGAFEAKIRNVRPRRIGSRRRSADAYADAIRERRSDASPRRRRKQRGANLLEIANRGINFQPVFISHVAAVQLEQSVVEDTLGCQENRQGTACGSKAGATHVLARSAGMRQSRSSKGRELMRIALNFRPVDGESVTRALRGRLPSP